MKSILQPGEKELEMSDEQAEALAFAKGAEMGLIERNELLQTLKDALKLIKTLTADSSDYEFVIERIETVIAKCSD